MSLVTRNYLIALLLGPLFLVPGFGIYGYLYTIFSKHNLGNIWDETFVYVAFGVVGLVIAYPATIIYGIPVMVMLQERNKFSLPNILAASVLPALLISVVSNSIDAWFWFGLSSASVAFGCWFVFNLASGYNKSLKDAP